MLYLVFLLCLPSLWAACPTDGLQFPQLETQPSLEQLQGVWLDRLSSRLADTYFYCTQQANFALNETSYRTDTTSYVGAQGTKPYSASFINVGVPQIKQELVFELVPASRTAHWFAGSLFFLIDYRPDDHVNGGYYSWMICNDSNEYEFHVSAREGTDLTGVEKMVLSILDEYNLNPEAQAFHQEPHDPTICSIPAPNVVSTPDFWNSSSVPSGECLGRGESCYKGEQCCSDRCSSWNAVVWTCA